VVDNESYFAVSAAAPICMQMMGNKAGDEFEVNGKRYRIEGVL
jgi:transcription elongation GreA/GreB family factor